jgi:hypothetical protein
MTTAISTNRTSIDRGFRELTEVSPAHGPGGARRGGSAGCVDIGADVGFWSVGWTGPSWSGVLLNAPNGGAGGTQCFLTGVGGVFKDNNDWNDGVFVNYGTGWWGGATDAWSLFVHGPKWAYVNCVQ